MPRKVKIKIIPNFLNLKILRKSIKIKCLNWLNIFFIKGYFIHTGRLRFFSGIKLQIFIAKIQLILYFRNDNMQFYITENKVSDSSKLGNLNMAKQA